MNDSELIETIRKDFISSIGVDLSDDNIMKIINTGRDMATISGGAIGIRGFIVALKQIIKSPNIVFYEKPTKLSDEELGL